MHRHPHLFFKRVCFALLCIGTCSTANAITSAKALGMGGTGTAHPQDAFATAYNPAGISEIEDRIDAGLFFLRSHGKSKISHSLNPVLNETMHSSRVKNIFVPEFGINKILYKKNCTQITAGLAVYNKEFIKTAYDRGNPLFGTSPLGLEYVYEVIAPTIALKTDSLGSLGLSLDYNIQRLKIEGAQRFANPFESISPQNVTNRGYDYSNGIGLTVGWMKQIHRTLTCGIAYRFETEMKNFRKYRGFVANQGEFNTTPRIALGIAYKPTCQWVICLDFEQIWRTRIPALKNTLFPNALKSRAGTRSGAGFDWRDQVYCRLGIAFQANEQWTLRAGYRHSPSPIKMGTAITSNIYTLECIEDVVTLGATWSWNPLFELSLFYAHGFPKTLKKNDIIPMEFGRGNVSLSEDQKDLYGLSLGWKY
jgi:long-chain fatty acid transport protein